MHRSDASFKHLPLDHVATCLADTHSEPLYPAMKRVHDVLALAGSCRAARAELNIRENRFLLSLLLTPEKKQEISDMLRHADMRVMDDTQVERLYKSLRLPSIGKNDHHDPPSGQSKQTQMRRRLLPLCEAVNGPDAGAALRACLRAVIDREAGETISKQLAWSTYMIRDEDLSAQGVTNLSNTTTGACYNHAQVRAAALEKHGSSGALRTALAHHRQRNAPIVEKRQHTQQHNKMLADDLTRVFATAAVDALRHVVHHDLRPLLQALRSALYASHPHLPHAAAASVYDYLSATCIPRMQENAAAAGKIPFPSFIISDMRLTIPMDVLGYGNEFTIRLEDIRRGVNDGNLDEKKVLALDFAADWLQKMQGRSTRAKSIISARAPSLFDPYDHLAACISRSDLPWYQQRARDIAHDVVVYVLLDSSLAQDRIVFYAPELLSA